MSDATTTLGENESVAGVSTPGAAPVNPPSPISSGRRRQRSFWIVAGILLISAIGLNATVGAMQVTFRKLPVEPQKPLKALPIKLGPWLQVSLDEALNHEIEETLAANQYAFRTYVDTRVITPDELKAFEGRNANDRLALAARLRQLHPGAVMNFALTYYTGLVDTVAHIPDRCYIADGYEVSKYTVLTWPVLPRPGEPAGAGRAAGLGELNVRYLTFENKVDPQRSIPTNVCYFFQVNGAYEDDPIGGVRKRLQNLLERHGYYAKVELMTQMRDTAESQAAMSDFLLHSMPEIEKVLPDWGKVSAEK